MKITRRTVLLGAAAAPPLVSRIARAQEGATSLRELARRAAVCLYPVQQMYGARWNATVNEANPLRHKLNRLQHAAAPVDDHLVSQAWLDLSGEPLFLTLPPMGDLHYGYAFLEPFTNNFAYVSSRLHGGEPRPRMIVGPKWQGDAPVDLDLVRAPSNSVWLIGRLQADATASDLDQIRQLQGRALLETPDMRNERRILETKELMRFRTIAPVEPVADWPAPNPADPFALFETGVRMLGESPIGERELATFEEFAALKLKPGRKFDARAFSEAELAAVRAGIDEGLAEIRGAARRYGRPVAGWSYPERHLGAYGDDHLYRAFTASTALGALEPAEAMVIAASADADGRPLTGADRYVLDYPANGLPPVRGFWTFSVLEGDATTGRTALTDTTPGVKRGADGSLQLCLQGARPEGEAAGNWLPAPAGPFSLVLRVYEPDKALVEGRYRLPGIRKIS